MGKSLRQKLSAGMVTFLLALPAGARADFAEDAAMGTATVLANVVYVPTKIAYATLGGLTGGFAYLLTGGNYTAAEKVWIPSLGGNYVLNTNQVWGQEPIIFSGEILPPQSAALRPYNAQESRHSNQLHYGQ
jgi:hypothetical protein